MAAIRRNRHRRVAWQQLHLRPGRQQHRVERPALGPQLGQRRLVADEREAQRAAHHLREENAHLRAGMEREVPLHLHRHPAAPGPLHQVRLPALGTRQLPALGLQRLQPREPVGADGQLRHPLRPGLLPHPQRRRRRHQRLVRGWQVGQAVGGCFARGQKGVLGCEE